MASKTTPLLFLILSIILFSGVSSETHIGGRKAGGDWQDIKNLNDPKVVEIGTFAVDEYNKNHPGEIHPLLYYSVCNGQYQELTSGTKYNLTVAVTISDPEPHYYLALVLDQPSAKTRQLISFAPKPNS